MTKLWETIAELGLELHPDRITSFASLLTSIKSSNDFSTIRQNLSPSINKKLIDQLENSWKEQSQIGASEIAAALLAASKTAELSDSRGKIEMVWTGPSSGMIPIRHTEQVLKEVISSAKIKLFLVSFIAYDVPSVSKLLNEAVIRGVIINIILDLSNDIHSNNRTTSVSRMKKAIPDANIYIWDKNNKMLSEDFSSGIVHAKCAVSDGEMVFITSANLTTPAMEKNIELGVLVKGGPLPDSLDKHLTSLIVTGILKQA
jgi:phosphatidylserine/phosphatidylglycerophosphate/cardiolipin synthase-like enzyme